MLKNFFAAALRVMTYADHKFDYFVAITNKYLTMKTLRQHFEHLTERAHDTNLSINTNDSSDDIDIDAYLANKYGLDDKFSNLTSTGQDIEPLDGEHTLVPPNPYMQSWGGKYATGGSSEPQWRYVEKGEDPARYGSDLDTTGSKTDLDWGKIAPALDLDGKKDNPLFRFNRFTHQVEPIDSLPTDSRLDDTDKPQPITWRDIYQLNKKTIGSDPRLIKPGQLLKMPNDQPDYTVQKGDSLVKIASMGQADTPAVRPKRVATPTPVQIEPKKITPTPGNIQPKVTANTGLNFPANAGFALDKGEEIVTPALIRARAQASADKAAYEKKQRDRADHQQAAKRSVKENSPEFMKQLRDFIAEAEVPADIAPRGMNRTMGSAIAKSQEQEKNGKYTGNFNQTAMFHDPANPDDNDYMDQSSTTTDGEDETSTRYATNVTPKWMAHLKAQAGLPVDPADEPPSQYPTQVGQGMNNKPFAAYSTAPGTMTVNRSTREGISHVKNLRDYMAEVESTPKKR